MSTITLHREAATAWLTLNRPDVGNATDLALARELAAAAQDMTTDPPCDASC